MVTKKKSTKSAKTKKGGIHGAPAPSGSPIIVDGGSVTIDFPPGAYHRIGNKHHSNNPDLQIQEIALKIGDVTQAIAVNGQKATITVTLQE